MVSRRLLLIGALLALGTPARAESLVVATGQTLNKIAKAHGCSVKEIERANAMHGTEIYAGETIEIPDDCKGDVPGTHRGRKKNREDLAVYGGDAGGRVKAIKGQSIGAPWDGHLVNGVKLPPGRGYYIRRPERSYGTTHMVTQIQRAIKAVRKRFPRVHVLAIGDLSAKHGGDIADHHSHESGRDADIGLYFKKKPSGYPQSFVSFTSGELDCAATWALLYAFARTADQPNGVEKIFLDTRLQRKLYEWAKSHGVPDGYLHKVFQVANSDGSGIVRYEPHHDNHMHVRFKCAQGDSRCED